MADMVQVLMEKMIPELEDLQEKKLFSKVRALAIVSWPLWPDTDAAGFVGRDPSDRGEET